MKNNKFKTGFLALVLAASCIVSQGCASTAATETAEADTAETETEEKETENKRQEPVFLAPSTETSSEDGGSDEVEDVKEETSIMIPEINFEPSEIPDSEAFEFVKNMKMGWNLGNTFDAYSDSYSGDDLNIESVWCGVKTSEDMIDMVKEAGFQSIRIPVSWHNHLEEGYQIKEAWFSRVQEVVDYAIDNDMYVIINIHHDISEDYIYPDEEHLEQSLTYMETIWQQLCERFRDYDEHLIFDSMNECRLVGSEYEWYLDTKKSECKEAMDCINQLNQKFVDVVRASGGNNQTRYLMIEGYDGSADGVLKDEFVLPTDIEGNDSKLLVSVHAYIPYNFALQSPADSQSVSEFDIESKSSTDAIDTMVANLYEKYISQNIPVVIGEFGARQKGDNLQSRVDFTAYYIAATNAIGIPCLWWDNNAFNGTGENFGLLDRYTKTWAYPEIVEAMVKYSE